MNLLWSFDLISHIALSIIRNKRSVILHYWQLTVFFFNEYFFLYVICEKNIKLNYWFIIFSGFKEIKKISTKRNFTMERKYKKLKVLISYLISWIFISISLLFLLQGMSNFTFCQFIKITHFHYVYHVV